MRLYFFVELILWGMLLCRLRGIQRFASRTDARDFSIHDVPILLADMDVDLIALSLGEELVTGVAAPVPDG